MCVFTNQCDISIQYQLTIQLFLHIIQKWWCIWYQNMTLSYQYIVHAQTHFQTQIINSRQCHQGRVLISELSPRALLNVVATHSSNLFLLFIVANIAIYGKCWWCDIKEFNQAIVIKRRDMIIIILKNISTKYGSSWMGKYVLKSLINGLHHMYMCQCKIHEKVIVFVNNHDLVFFAVNKA